MQLASHDFAVRDTHMCNTINADFRWGRGPAYYKLEGDCPLPLVPPSLQAHCTGHMYNTCELCYELWTYLNYGQCPIPRCPRIREDQVYLHPWTCSVVSSIAYMYVSPGVQGTYRSRIPSIGVPVLPFFWIEHIHCGLSHTTCKLNSRAAYSADEKCSAGIYSNYTCNAHG